MEPISPPPALSGCGLDFHKRCAFLLPNDCSRVRRQVSTSFSLFPPRRPQTHSLSNPAGGSLEEVRSGFVTVHSAGPLTSRRYIKTDELSHLSVPRSACPNPPPGLRPGRSLPCGSESGAAPSAGHRSLTPSTSTATPNPPCASTATDCSKGCSGRGCSAQVRGWSRLLVGFKLQHTAHIGFLCDE